MREIIRYRGLFLVGYSLDSFMRCHLVYKDEWTPFIGESLNCMREPQNVTDKNAVAVMKDDKVVGHVPISYSRWGNQFLQIPSSISSCKVTKKGYEIEAVDMF